MADRSTSMSAEHDKELAEQIGRELARLPELRAPVTLAPRVLQCIQQRSIRPWYLRSWQSWPPILQGISLLILLALFGSICFGGWKLSQLEPVTVILRNTASLFAVIDAFNNTMGALTGSFLLIAKQLGTGVLIACIIILGLGYAFCVGIGAVYLKVALAATRPVER